ncbi:CopG family transcriptional regulator [Brevundimonas sp. P7753]|uniref:CopG family transcriptional regulator n=1 Tax=Brevundimonas sp. P7753 TaxID=2726982 RepID=UPI0021039B8C|nr:CopG family transcriptional regulator [Brevundimonas sp. P7753]
MKKPFLTVYLTPELLDLLVAQAKRRGVPKSTVAEAAIASFLTPDAAQQQEAALGRRLDRLNRHADRLERDLEIAVEMLALFVRTWMAATPSLPDAAQAAARVRGRDRYERFVENLGRRLASGRSFTRELAFELEAATRDDVVDRASDVSRSDIGDAREEKPTS